MKRFALVFMLAGLQLCSANAQSATDRCARQYLQDGEAAETPEQQANFDRCVSAAQKARFRPWQRIWQCSDIRRD
jgi:hypothetical protein